MPWLAPLAFIAMTDLFQAFVAVVSIALLALAFHALAYIPRNGCGFAFCKAFVASALDSRTTAASGASLHAMRGLANRRTP
jgi:hypothetical protein